MSPYYTHYPRPILWLVRGGEVTVGGDEDDARPAFRVEVEPFYVSKFPVTNEQYEAYDPGFERSPLAPGDRDPAVGVSWRDAAGYCRWYAEVARKPMRLPTEVEWEHACRAGATGRYFTGDDPAEVEGYLWDADNSGGRLHPLDDKRANDFGLYGTLGGVWEWTASPYRPYPLDGAEEDAGDDLRRVLRGGSFRTPRSEISCSRRRPEPADVAVEDAGFRIVKSLRR
jgi:formylglycine-generating enzyme required for sulfatase activity